MALTCRSTESIKGSLLGLQTGQPWRRSYVPFSQGPLLLATRHLTAQLKRFTANYSFNPKPLATRLNLGVRRLMADSTRLRRSEL